MRTRESTAWKRSARRAILEEAHGLGLPRDTETRVAAGAVLDALYREGVPLATAARVLIERMAPRG